jgi:biopolymer transport protein ExbD
MSIGTAGGLEKDSSSQSSTVLGDINVTPMVDVMLVLLIIFMVVTPALLTGFQATLPTGKNLKERPDDDQRVTLGIDMGGRYYLNRQMIDRDDALNVLRTAFEQRPQDKVLFLKADRNLPYSEVMQAMQIARDAGARVVAAVSEATPDPEPEGGG